MRRALACLVLSFLCAAGAWSATAGKSESLLIRVERKAADDLAVLRVAGIPVVMETNPCLFVLGGPADVAALTARGYTSRVIDPEAASADYFIVGLRPDSDAAFVRAAGTVLLSEENWVLIRVPLGTSPVVLDDAKAFIGRVPREPAAIPKPAPEAATRSALLPNPIVQKIVASVADADIQTYWQALVNNPPTGTRYSTAQGCRDAATYCFNQYAALKIPAQYQNWNASNAPNVIGSIDGATTPGNVYIVEAHLDDLPTSGAAPGADDNASGSVAVLTSAKALACWGVKNTVKFLNVTGEEAGLLGSDAYAADAATRGENILGVINYDMIGWQGDGIPAVENLDLDYNAPSQWLAQRFVDAAANYGTGLVVNPILCPSLNVSDHYPFWQRGWAAICGITDNEDYCGAAGNYPAYHTSGDTIAANGNPAFFYKVVKTTVATLAELGDPFKITFGADAFGCGLPIQVILADPDLNTNPGVVESVGVHVWSTSEPAGETMTLGERGVTSKLFSGTMPTTSLPAAPGDGMLTVAAGDTIHVDYVDALDCDGAAGVAYSATAGTDCTAPVISGVSSSNVTGNSATINWSTDEASTSVVHYGTTPPGASTASSSTLVTSHALGLTGLAECTPYSYWVESADAVGNTASDNAGGAYYGFATGKNTNPNYGSTDTPLPIPDNSPTGVTSTINVTDSKTVLDVNVTVNITHTFDGDIALYLIAPNATQITLSNRRGSSGDNYTATIFDDAAATPIANGTAPFTGSFKPETPLSAANGIPSNGNWMLKVVDSAGQDVGTINNWTLSLTFPAAQCGPHAAYSGKSSVADTCAVGGAGNANGTWDPGEQVQFKVTIANDGTSTLTGVTATVASTTPGVVMLDGTASYADLAPGVSGDSLAPHFTAKLPSNLVCGSLVAFNVTIQSAQGSWGGSFTQSVGAVVSGGGTALNEAFTSGIPATWTVVDGGAGGGASATWNTANPGGRTWASPMAAPGAIVDSDNAGSGATQDEQLITPVMNLSTATSVTLEFDEYFRWYSSSQNEIGDVDVRSSLTGGSWVNVLRQQGASSLNPEHKTINITAQAAGAANVQVRFHYYQASFEWFWQLDNVKVTYTAPGGCQTNVCLAPSAPPPVPDGSFGTAMTGSRGDPSGTSINLTWDVASCAAPNYHLLYGDLATVASYAIGGSACAIGTSGTATWSGVPAGSLWFVIAADDGAATEGSWGTGAGGERGGGSVSGQCGMASRSNAGTCP
jgi:subtilisin-like proprotein convertase family protein